MDFLRVTFRIDVPPEEATEFVESILLEQTVETPAEVAVRYKFVREHMIGSIQSIEPVNDTSVLATLELPVVTAGVDPAQFLNVLFGNVSLHEQVLLERFDLPPSLRSGFRGPRFGIEGFRRRLGVSGRPLTCSALKPVGLPVESLAGICRTFVMGGIDVIKDDHYLADHPFSPFSQRVVACQQAVDDANSASGHGAIYCPNLSGTPDDILRQLEFAQNHGVGAVMIAPALVGLPFVHQIVTNHLDVPLLAHPSFAGSTRIPPVTYLGRLFRLFGSDAVIFANYGGRFSYSADDSLRIASALRASWYGIRASLPVPAGGMTVERVPELIDYFGNDTMLLIGGSLLAAGDALYDRTRSFTEAVSSAAAEAGASKPA